MLCQNCGKKEATTYFKETINGKVREMQLCPDCAAQMGLPQTFGSFFSPSFWGDEPLFGVVPQMLSSARHCPTCGMTERALRESGKVGCADCYDVFSELLMPYIRRLHGSTAHVGLAPKTEQAPATNPVEELKARLKDAVTTENYEEAARLRDEIRRQEQEG